jgi:maltose alpha-D-glucosyltransferase/alpha-amylase
VSNEGDGWNHAIDYLERFLEQRAASPGPPAPDAHGGFLSLMQTLGTRTGELHAAFAQRSPDPAFDPEPVTEEDLTRWKQSVAAQADASLDLLAARRSQLTSPAREEALELIARREALLERIDACRLSAGAAFKTRFHGDYHLGQVLLSKMDFLIIDFEGEPARSFEERRRKHSPLRDVAGMLRSFNYAHWTALRRALHGHADFDRLAPFAEAWEAAVRDTFLQAYESAVRGTGLYASFEEMRGLLDLFEMEKALYELRYELANRPAWVGIPLNGILARVG